MSHGVIIGEASRAAGPPSLRGKILFWIGFALLDAVAMSREAFTLGLYLLVFPALALAAVHWGFLILPLIDWPLSAWRRTRRAGWAVFWFAMALVFPVGLPALLNLSQAAHVALDRAFDVMPAAPAAAEEPVLLAGDCAAECARLIASGALPRAMQLSAYAPGGGDRREWRDGSVRYARLRFASTYCDDERSDEVLRLREHPGWCLVGRGVTAPDYRTVVVFTGFHTAGGRSGRRRIEVWRCEQGCRLVARATERRGSHLAVPLRIGYVGDSLYLDPRFARRPFVAGDADPERVLGRALGLSYGRAAPRLGEDPSAARAAERRSREAEAAEKARVEARRLAFLEQQRRETAAAVEQRRREALFREERRRPSRCRQFEKGGVFGSVCD